MLHTFVVFFLRRGAFLSTLSASLRAPCPTRAFFPFLFALLFLFRFDQSQFLSGHQTVTTANFQGDAGLFWSWWGRGGCSCCFLSQSFLSFVTQENKKITFKEHEKVTPSLRLVGNLSRRHYTVTLDQDNEYKGRHTCS